LEKQAKKVTWSVVDLTDKLEVLAGELLTQAGMTVSLAESCTGGLVGHLLTEVPGSSRYFLGGVVAYDDSVKTALLDVPPSLIRQYGAVSAECALQMARAVRGITGSDIGISVTGVAGPTGGTAAKPVGTVYVALTADGAEKVERFGWHDTRSGNKRHSAEAALRMLVGFLQSRSRASEAALPDTSSN
jgi:nicotinamide-nucleotide amidase